MQGYKKKFYFMKRQSDGKYAIATMAPNGCMAYLKPQDSGAIIAVVQEEVPFVFRLIKQNEVPFTFP